MDFNIFNGQFFAGPEALPGPPDWHHRSLSGWVLHAHPTLRIVDLTGADGAVVGWVTGEPSLDGEPVSESLPLYPSENQPAEPGEASPEARLYDLGGPWIAFVLGEGTPRVFGDAVGHLSVVYSREATVVATSPSLIPETPGTLPNNDLVTLMGIPVEDNYYPFGLTSRKNVFRLLPNFSLDLDRWETTRIWPRTIPSNVISVDEAAASVANIVKQNIRALAARYPLQMSLTAGIDSRMILACVRDRAPEMRFVTNRSHPKTAALDIAAARYFARRHGLNHIVRQPVRATEDERAAWLLQTGSAVAGSAYHHLALTNAYGTERARLSGQGGEVIRGYYYRRREPKASSTAYTTEEVVARLHLPYNDEVLEAANRWLSTIPECSGETFLDLLYVEQRMGCWAASLRYGSTSAHMVFWPICHRKVLEIMLRLTPDAKRHDRIHNRIIEHEWPELMEIPVNDWFGWEKVKREWIGETLTDPRRIVRRIIRRFRKKHTVAA